MNKEKLKDLILSFCQDVIFQYHGENACINPYNKNKFEVGYGDKAKIYTDIDELMDDKFYDGKSLNQISESLDIE